MWKGFHPKTNLTRHKKVHLNGKFTCNRCFEHFGSETSLEEHASKVHSTSVNQPNNFFCETCGKEFGARRSLVRHQEVHTEKEIRCKELECTASFKTTRNLQDHQYTVHRNDTYSCDQCQKSFTNRAYLKLVVKVN